jgi:hypothetical protein
MFYASAYIIVFEISTILSFLHFNDVGPVAQSV